MSSQTDTPPTFTPEDAARAKHLLDVRNRIHHIRRELQNGLVIYRLRDLVLELTSTIEMLIFGEVIDAGNSQIPGDPLNPADSGQQVQIFMPNPGQAVITPRPEQPPVEIMVPLATSSPPALPPVPIASPGALDPATAAALAAITPHRPQAQAAPQQRGAAFGMMTIQQRQAMIDLAKQQPSAGPVYPTNVNSPTAQRVEIFPPDDPRAPLPAKV